MFYASLILLTATHAERLPLLNLTIIPHCIGSCYNVALKHVRRGRSRELFISLTNEQCRGDVQENWFTIKGSRFIGPE